MSHEQTITCATRSHLQHCKLPFVRYEGCRKIYEKDQMIIFTNSFIKKNQKTPPREIEKAKMIREAYHHE